MGMGPGWVGGGCDVKRFAAQALRFSFHFGIALFRFRIASLFAWLRSATAGNGANLEPHTPTRSADFGKHVMKFVDDK